MSRNMLGKIAWFVALICVVIALCLVARWYIVTPFSWLKHGLRQDTFLIRADALPVLSVGAEPQSKCSGVRCALYGLRGRGTNFRGQQQHQGPSQSVGIMCLFYGSTYPAIDGWLRTIIQADESLVYMCDL